MIQVSIRLVDTEQPEDHAEVSMELADVMKGGTKAGASRIISNLFWELIKAVNDAEPDADGVTDLVTQKTVRL